MRAVLTNPDRSGLMILLAILCWFMGYNALDTWISSFGRFDLDIDVGRMAMITSGFAALFVVFAVPSGLIATRFGRKRIIMIGIIGLSSLFVFGWFIQSQTMLIIMLVLAGIFWALINVNSLPMVFDVGGEDKLGAYTGLYYFAASIAAIAGPQTVGFLVDLTGASYRIMFVFSAVFMILAGTLHVPGEGEEIGHRLNGLDGLKRIFLRKIRFDPSDPFNLWPIFLLKNSILTVMRKVSSCQHLWY